MFPADENIPIALPTDLGEVKRLMLQHIQLKIFLGANFYGPVREVLTADAGDRQKRGLDLITAEGSWYVSALTRLNVISNITSQGPRYGERLPSCPVHQRR
jgi:hypothetical protein